MGEPRLCNPPAGNHGRLSEVAVVLVAAGAKVEPELLESEKYEATRRYLPHYKPKGSDLSFLCAGSRGNGTPDADKTPSGARC
jgi:hypothetical protein